MRGNFTIVSTLQSWIMKGPSAATVYEGALYMHYCGHSTSMFHQGALLMLGYFSFTIFKRCSLLLLFIDGVVDGGPLAVIRHGLCLCRHITPYTAEALPLGNCLKCTFANQSRTYVVSRPPLTSTASGIEKTYNTL